MFRWPAGRGHRIELNITHETSISTVENPPETAARISQSQFLQEWPRHSGQSAPRRAQTVDAGLMLAGAMSVESSPALTFPRASRIKQSRDFARARANGKRLVRGCLILNWLPASSSRLGVITSGKLGNAVVRNRARRLLRESFRLHQHQLTQPVDLILVARASITGKQFSAVEADYLTALRHARLLKETV